MPAEMERQAGKEANPQIDAITAPFPEHPNPFVFPIELKPPPEHDVGRRFPAGGIIHGYRSRRPEMRIRSSPFGSSPQRQTSQSQ